MDTDSVCTEYLWKIEKFCEIVMLYYKGPM